MSELAGRVAIVTGSSRNIGAAIARELAAGGAAVVVNARTSARDAETVAARIRDEGGRATAVMADVGTEDGAAAVVAAALSAFGRLDVLVNNAAVRREAALADVTLDAWRETLRVVLDGAFLCTRHAASALRTAGSGAVVNIGGLTARTGARERVHVVTAKAGLEGMTRALALELAAGNVTVNCVAPGMIETQRDGPEPAHRAERETPLGRRGAPQDIAAAVRWLAGPNARYVTGQTIAVNGGAYLV